MAKTDNESLTLTCSTQEIVLFVYISFAGRYIEAILDPTCWTRIFAWDEQRGRMGEVVDGH